MIRAVGTYDKPLLVLAVVAAVLGLGAVAGRWESRRANRGLALALLVGLIGAACAVAGSGSAAAAVASVVAGVTSAVALALWTRRTTPAVEPSIAGRRDFLVAAAVAAGALVAGGLGQAVTAVRRTVRQIVLPPAANPRPPVPLGIENTTPGLSRLVTPVADFYRVDTALVVPRIDPDQWRLEIDGMVSTPRSYSIDDLLARPLVEHDITLSCVSNPVGGKYVSSTRFIGVLVADLLAEAGPLPGADQVISTSWDGFTAGTPVAVLTDGRPALIALGMGGRPLVPEHGAPARLVTPGLYGYVGATKWVTKLTLTTFAATTAYWAQRGWAEQAPVKPTSRIDTPIGGTSVKDQVVVAGVAWAPHDGVARVDVSVDGAAWESAELGPEVGLDYWRQWRFPIDLPAGDHEVKARVVTVSGVVQDHRVTDELPDGATGLHTVRFVVS